jgi:hypothetical protein
MTMKTKSTSGSRTLEAASVQTADARSLPGLRIFLAGASGVLGQRLIPRLVQAGHVVGGLTRSPSKTELLNRLGAEPIVCDVFDREALIQAVRDFKPDVVLNELTDLPDDVTPNHCSTASPRSSTCLSRSLYTDLDLSHFPHAEGNNQH